MRITAIHLHQPIGLLRVVTDTGIEGVVTGVAPEIGQLLLTHCAPALIGADALDRERLWLELARIDRDGASSLRAYLDAALWDLVAKRSNLPLYRFINGFRTRIPALLRGSVTLDRDGLLDEIEQARRDGYTGYRMRAPVPVDSLIDLLPAVSKAFGEDRYLIIDGGQAFTLSEAIRLGRALDGVGVFCFDRPRPDGDLTGSGQVARSIDTPVSLGVTSLIGASQTLSAQAADHLHAGLPESGGVTDLLKIARCAEAFGALIHIGSTDFCHGFARLQLLGALKNAPFYEVDPGSPVPSYIHNPIVIDGGFAVFPDAPGLGIELDAHAVAHLTESVTSVS